jgi:ubiquinone/menaquinone biosynthesis C-methylase UbiE
MTGVDATSAVVELGRTRCAAEGLSDRIAFVLADAVSSGLPAASADFVWGEDAWCYVTDKAALIAEAARVVAEMEFIQHLAREGKIEQCMLVAKTRP